MKKYIFNIPVILLFAVMTMVASCDLDEFPKHVVGPENFFNNPAQIEAVMTATMRRSYTSWGSYSYNPAFHRHTDHMGGDLRIQTNFGADMWRIHWANIKDLNFAIRGIVNGRLTGTDADEINLLMGQLKFLRAWNYFQLVRHWGDVPVLTEEDTDDYFSLEPERASVAKVYELIASDFLEAIDKLPSEWESSKAGRPAKDAARGLLAKAYVTMATAPLNDASCYAKAAAMAKTVMDAGNYKLVEDIKNVFSKETKYGPEIMWSFNANNEIRSTTPQVWTPLDDGWGDYSVDRVWAEEVYPEQPRKYAYLHFYNREGVYYVDIPENRPGVKKFLYDTPEDFDNYVATYNQPIIRYADVLLIFAEAENMANGGPTQAAVDAINQVIDRANGNLPNPDYPLLTTSMTKEAFDKAVINERSYELCYEFDRWRSEERRVGKECRSRWSPYH